MSLGNGRGRSRLELAEPTLGVLDPTSCCRDYFNQQFACIRRLLVHDDIQAQNISSIQSSSSSWKGATASHRLRQPWLCLWCQARYLFRVIDFSIEARIHIISSTFFPSPLCLWYSSTSHLPYLSPTLPLDRWPNPWFSKLWHNTVWPPGQVPWTLCLGGQWVIIRLVHRLSALSLPPWHWHPGISQIALTSSTSPFHLRLKARPAIFAAACPQLNKVLRIFTNPTFLLPRLRSWNRPWLRSLYASRLSYALLSLSHLRPTTERW